MRASLLQSSARRLISTQRKADVTQSQPGLEHFIKDASIKTASKRLQAEPVCNCDDPNELRPCSKSLKCQYRVDSVPVYIRTYGCQMNENDTSIIKAILTDYGYQLVPDDATAEIQLLMTCAIRESAEAKIWTKLRSLKRLKNDPQHPLRQVGLLGCMAERLKQKVLETENTVDIVAGPDAYRDLPRLFSINRMSNEKAINCLLSFDETYSDIRPVTNINDVSSFISITRGCDNLCSYCIVPFTRGRERSRPLPTIVDEVRNLLNRGIKEVTLLGQNVNSYRDLSTPPQNIGRHDLVDVIKSKESPAEGFKTVYKPRTRGLTFDILLEEIAKISPELRIRFTSPHPKDFTDDVIEVMSRYPNIARCVHLPAQSGSTSVLERMRRGYSKEAYLKLVERLRAAMPNLAITSDFIAGFCGETDEDHQQTLDLLRQVRYNFIYSFPYSERTKTHAYHKLDDNLSHSIKTKRVREILELFRSIANELNQNLVTQTHLVLVESESSRSSEDWQGRIDQNINTIIPKCELTDRSSGVIRSIKPGDYVACRIIAANSQTLKAQPLYITSQAEYHQRLADGSDHDAFMGGRDTAKKRSECHKHPSQEVSASIIKPYDEIPTKVGFLPAQFGLILSGGPGHLHEHCDKMHKELGPIYREKLGSHELVFIADTKMIQTVIANEGPQPHHNVPDAWLLYNQFRGIDRGLFFQVGEPWSKLRQALNKVMFSNARINGFTNSICELNNDLIDNWTSTVKDSGAGLVINDVKFELCKWSIEATGLMLFGQRMGCLSGRGSDLKAEQLVINVANMFNETSKFQIVPAKLAQKLNLKSWKRFVAASDTMINLASEYANEFIARAKLPDSSESLLKDLIGLDILNDDEISRSMVDLIIAAADTTSNSLQWMLYMLARHPESQARIFDELHRSSSGEQQTIGSYLNSFVKEVSRLYPTAPFLARTLDHPVTLANYVIPAGTPIVFSLYTTSRMEEYFEDPLTFKPERWFRIRDPSSPSGIQKQSAHAYATLPFGIGARMCIGRRMADLEMHQLITSIVSRFTVNLANPRDDIKIKLKMILCPDKPISIRLTPRA